MKENIKYFFALLVLSHVLLVFPVWGQSVSDGTLQLDYKGKPTDDNGESSALSKAYFKNVPIITEVFTREVGTTGIGEISKHYFDEAIFLKKVKKQFLKEAKQRGLSRGHRKRALKAIENDIESNKGLSKWFKKAGQFLDMIDLVSTSAKSMAYLAEGDKEGAIGVFVSDVAKKATVAATSFGLSAIPVVGTTIGAEVGEQIHETYTAPAIEGAVHKLRVQKKIDEMLGFQPPPTIKYNRDGSVTALPPEYYHDQNNVIRKRTPTEQKAFKNQYRKKALQGNKDLQRFEKENPEVKEAREALEDKKMTDGEYTAVVRTAMKRDWKRKWMAAKGPTLSGPMDDDDGDEVEEKPDEGEEEPEEDVSQKDESEQEAEEEEYDVPEVTIVGKPGILKHVDPIRVTAAMKVVEDHSSGEFGNIVTTTITLSFYNVGAMAPGYGKAVMKMKSVSSRGPVDESVATGVFTGGPNGAFKLTDEGDTKVFKLINGKYVGAPGGKMQVSNPGAFANWPD